MFTLHCVSCIMCHMSCRVTKTLAAWQRCCAEILPVWWILRKFSPKFTLFCCKIPSKCHTAFMEKFPKKFSVLLKKIPQKLLPPCLKFPQKVAFMVNFHQKMPLWQISTKRLPLREISTKLCSVGKFPQQQALLENFRKKLLC